MFVNAPVCVCVLSEMASLGVEVLENDVVWGRVLHSMINDIDSLADVRNLPSPMFVASKFQSITHSLLCLCLQWRMTSRYSVLASVERITRAASQSADQGQKDWALAYRYSMVQLVQAVTQLAQFYHADQVTLFYWHCQHCQRALSDVVFK